MRLERLTKAQVEDIYKNKMAVDFPKPELKPLEVVLDTDFRVSDQYKPSEKPGVTLTSNRVRNQEI